MNRSRGYGHGLGYSRRRAPRRWRRWVVAVALTLAAGAGAVWHLTRSPGPIYAPRWSNLAIEGYDAVAYRAEAGAIPGDARFEVEWRGVLWRFASAANRDAFLTAPSRYTPAYGGYDALSVTQGDAVPSDPRVWSVDDGRLFLHANAAQRDAWTAALPDAVAEADAKWPEIRDAATPP